MKATVQGALAHADVPFQQIVSDLNVPRNAAYSPVFQTMFALDNDVPDPQDAAAAPADNAGPIEVRISMKWFTGVYTIRSGELIAYRGIKCDYCANAHFVTMATWARCLSHKRLADRNLD